MAIGVAAGHVKVTTDWPVPPVLEIVTAPSAPWGP
jgi:hypothetical protein